MNRGRWGIHPILIFIFSILALGTSLFLYIYWYMEVSTGLKAVITKFNLDSGQVFEPQTWVVILVLSILVAIILLGIFTIFVYHQKTLQLYRLQRNFINNFTHELKTPVTSINLYLETFLKYELPRKDQQKYINYMLSDINRLSDNINRILNLAKIEGKTFGGELVRTDLVKTLSRFLEQNRHVFRHCRISVSNPAKRPFYFSINRSLFEMLLMNLITNAIKYNRAENTLIEISFKSQKRKLHLRFKDNGIGFETSEIKKIFRKFYQVGRADDMTAKGSGLGLHLVQIIARFHKGKVVAHSRGRGQGSVFTLILPLPDSSG